MFQVSFPQVFHTESEWGSHLETLVEGLHKVFYRVLSIAYLREFHHDFMRLKKWLCREDFGVLGTIKREVS